MSDLQHSIKKLQADFDSLSVDQVYQVIKQNPITPDSSLLTQWTVVRPILGLIIRHIDQHNPIVPVLLHYIAQVDAMQGTLDTAIGLGIIPPDILDPSV